LENFRKMGLVTQEASSQEQSGAEVKKIQKIDYYRLSSIKKWGKWLELNSKKG